MQWIDINKVKFPDTQGAMNYQKRIVRGDEYSLAKANYIPE